MFERRPQSKSCPSHKTQNVTKTENEKWKKASQLGQIWRKLKRKRIGGDLRQDRKWMREMGVLGFNVSSVGLRSWRIGGLAVHGVLTTNQLTAGVSRRWLLYALKGRCLRACLTTLRLGHVMSYIYFILCWFFFLIAFLRRKRPNFQLTVVKDILWHFSNIIKRNLSLLLLDRWHFFFKCI